MKVTAAGKPGVLTGGASAATEKTADEILGKVAAYCHRISDSGH